MKVHATIADGVAINRKFFNLIATKKPFEDKEGLYEAFNPYAQDPKRTILLIVDPSHLLKVGYLYMFM